MYGLLLENLATFIKIQWGEGKWESVRRHAGIDTVAFSIHHVYSETLMQRLARSCFQVLGVDERQFFEALGLHFVSYVSQYGYDQILSVLGRHMRDFLNGLDNLHEYLKFSYPKMRAPSFYCEDETETGLKLHYRSKRRGFVYYVMGQIKQVANQFYRQNCEILLLTEELVGETMHVVFQLNFDNSAFTEAESIRGRIAKDLKLPVQASTLFELFPFCIVFNKDMEITHTGHALMTILKDLVGQIMTEAFDMIRPLIPFCFSAVMQRRNNIFELVTVAPIHDVNHFFGANDNTHEEVEGTRLRIRGQMLYMHEWDMMLYLANPVMPDLTSLVEAGLFVNDLSLHDCSRDFVLAGTQQSVELKLALDQEQQKSRKLVESMKKLDEEMKRTDELLYQMIPRLVADRIRNGENPVDTCQTFEMVSILFSDVVNFTDICSKITPMQVVTMLNHMYSLFDQLTERNGVYKVETIGDSYMVVSGAPEQDVRHAERICDMAMDMVDASEAIEDPSEGIDAKSLRVRVGCHSGTVVGGVVGVKMPRWCLFGDCVNLASRMESTSDACRIQISEVCRSLLPSIYQIEFRGTIPLKGKGNVSTYWLNGRDARIPLSKYHSKAITWTAPTTTVSQRMAPSLTPSIKNLELTNAPMADRVAAEMPIVTASGSVPISFPGLNSLNSQRSRPCRRSTASKFSPSSAIQRRPATTSNSTISSVISIRRNSFAVEQKFEKSHADNTSFFQTTGSDSIENVPKASLHHSEDFGISFDETNPVGSAPKQICTLPAPKKLHPPKEKKSKETRGSSSRRSEISSRGSGIRVAPGSEPRDVKAIKTGMCFFHSCLTGGTLVDNPVSTSSTPGIVAVKVNEGANSKRSKVVSQGKKTDSKGKGRVDQPDNSALQVPKFNQDFEDIYLTHAFGSHSSASSRRIDSNPECTVSRSCSLV